MKSSCCFAITLVTMLCLGPVVAGAMTNAPAADGSHELAEFVVTPTRGSRLAVQTPAYLDVLSAEELQLEQLLDEPRELTDLPPLENPNREMLFFTRLLLHFSQGGNGELELGTSVSNT